MPGRRCPAPRCPRIITTGRYCPDHARAYEAKRGTSTQRGYDQQHRATSRAWKARVKAGERVTCWRCGELITNASDLDLGHDDDDRSVVRGPEHARSCNRSNAGRRGRAVQG